MEKNQELRKFVAPEFIFGIGARRHAGRYAKNLGGRKILVVTDPGVIEAGWADDIIRSLEENGLRWVVFSRVSPNPRSEEVLAGAKVFDEEKRNAIAAVGGGSPMDCAKGVGIVSTNREPILEFEGVDRVFQPMPPLICIPTTAGSSADVSQFAIITNTEERYKMAIVSKAVIPDVSLIDPLTLTTMSPYLTACTGLDALTHAIEAFVSNAHSPISDLHALEAIRLVCENLVPSVNHPQDPEVRSRVMLGSLYAGLAFSNAILGATHAMAHSLGGYLDLAHGECNAILLDRVVEFNFPSAPKRFERVAEAMGLNLRGMTAGRKKSALVDRIRILKKEAGLERNLAVLGVRRADIPQLTGKALNDPCMVTNPRQPSRQDVEVLYEEAL